ncbi:class I SAM-dependent methyltransferase [Cellulomonas dongxiuzhuiae]|uniref:class I SAM-dependent methyltransferase n=1 Tax=Cellulomonas dongxiuzhuiae TaxID=2819979 RepID=UPI001AAEB71B|nr:class I SAM-dependent methyltransferase [Cellulomonas dongxiuzhuiae]MBO3086701.1 class I SAM-dependent methyltransferase [Cellulomonas dongxiuzhuiae]
MTDALGIDNDGERMIPAFHRPSLLYAEHLTRYLAAAEIVRGKRVLDIASGSGYGSSLLAGTAASVVGVDVSEVAVSYAARTYGAGNLEFRHGDAEKIPLEDDSVDVVVTFETIEHVADYHRFVAEIDRVLAPGGIALVSTPNDLEFVEGNHFHLHEFVYDELLELLAPHFGHISPYFQATWQAVAIGTLEQFATEGVVQAEIHNLAPLERDQYLYFYLVCSREPTDATVPSVLALGGHHSDRAIQQRDLGTQGRIDALETALAQAHRDLAQAHHDLDTVRATRSHRIATGLSSVAGRLRLARR